MHYILSDEGEVEKTDLHGWVSWIDGPNKSNKIIIQDEFEVNGNLYLASTIFLGLDHRFTEDESADPILFETMLFKIYGKSLKDPIEGGEYQVRYTTMADALQGHADCTSRMIQGGAKNTNTNKGPIIERMESKYGRSFLPAATTDPQKIENS